MKASQNNQWKFSHPKCSVGFFSSDCAFGEEKIRQSVFDFCTSDLLSYADHRAFNKLFAFLFYLRSLLWCEFEQ